MASNQGDLKHLSPAEKREAIRLMMAARQGAKSAPTSTAVESKEQGRFPVALAQQRLWILSRLNPESPAYNLMYAFQLKGTLCRDALHKALNEIARRHQVLRCSFGEEQGEPVIVIEEPGAFPVLEHTLSHLADEERALAVQQMILKYTLMPFQLELAPLCRVLLLKLGDEAHNLAVVMHHLITDNVSYQIFFRELGALYNAYKRNAPSPLPPLPMQFNDYVLKERQYLGEQLLAKQMTYWKSRLAGLVVTELPPDKHRPSLETYRGAQHLERIPLELKRRSLALTREALLTEHMFFMAAFMALLFRHGDQTDVNCGVPVANRGDASVAQLIGFFTNTLVMRTQFDGNPSFREILARTRETSIGAVEHPHVPFELLVKELAPERDLSRNPLYQIIFQVAMRIPLEMADLTLEESNLMDYGLVRCDLEFYLFSDAQHFTTLVVYNRDLYHGSTIARMVSRFCVLLDGVMAQPDTPLAYIPILAEEERECLVMAWNQTQATAPLATATHQFISQTAALYPDRPALVCEGRELSYAQLERQANRLAHRLIELGADAGKKVGICLRRGEFMVVSLLAVLKSGASYVPMDPSFPASRLDLTLEEAGLWALIAAHEDEAPLVGYKGQLLWQEDLAARLDDPEHDPNLPVCGQQLAYTIFTSGSTGRPKGVMISQRALSNLLLSVSEKPGIGIDDCLIALTTLSFDIAALELYLPLLVGAKLVVATREQAMDGQALAGLISAHRATMVQATPATWRMLIDSGWVGAPNLKILCGGEALPADLASQLLGRGASLWNMYGPTETTIWSAVSAVPSLAPNQVVPIGHPIANTTIYVLDRQGQTCPAGVPGELVIGGEGLARGYLNKPAMTAEKFVPNTLSHEPGSRLYRSGDLVRFVSLPSGQPSAIAFLGRFDNQIKLRGFRIELGDIESVLAENAAVQQAVILLDAASERLAAYVLVKGEAPSSAELRAFAAQKLPAYMVPDAYLIMEAFPLTPNGKIDRKALPPLERDEGQTPKGYVAPSSADQQKMAGIWAETLKLERVGLNDNFFEIGGHSLLANKVLSRVRESFELDISLGRFFESPTVAGLCSAIAAYRENPDDLAIPELAPAPRQERLPLSSAQQRLWFMDQMEPGSTFYNLPFATRLRGPLNVEALGQAFDQLEARHEILRTVFGMDGTDPVQVIVAAGSQRLELKDLSGADAEARSDEEIAAVCGQGFKLSQAPLWRARLVRLAEQDHLLIICMHHIITDGWSIGIISGELSAFYQANLEGRPPQLAPMVTQYADYSVWQRSWLSGEVERRQMAYWRKALSSPPELSSPASNRPEVQSFVGANMFVDFDAALIAALRQLANSQGTTLFTALFTAFSLMLHQASGQSDLLIGTDVANRGRAKTEHMIGFFVNQIAVRCRFEGDPSFRQLVLRTRDTLSACYHHQDLGFDKVVEVVKPTRHADRAPLFQVKLVLHSEKLEHIGETIMERREIFSNTSQLDMTVNLSDEGAGVSGRWEYSTNLFKQITIESYRDRFEMVMKMAAENPDVRLSVLVAQLNESVRSAQMAAQKQGAEMGLKKLGKLRRRGAAEA